jgi:hypothetical protein
MVGVGFYELMIDDLEDKGRDRRAVQNERKYVYV